MIVIAWHTQEWPRLELKLCLRPVGKAATIVETMIEPCHLVADLALLVTKFLKSSRVDLIKLF